MDLKSGKQGFVPTTYGPLYYCSEGEDKENIVLVLHDLGESSKSSRRYSEGIKNASLKLMIDLPGHGETGPSHLSNYSPQSMARMIREALKNLKVERISVLAVGGSLPIALRLAESRELSVDRLAALDPWFLNDQEKEEFKGLIFPILPQHPMANIFSKHGILHVIVNYIFRGISHKFQVHWGDCQILKLSQFTTKLLNY
ncbi:MAG: hypothetical protein Ct9H300mP6_00720 [Gammaproteobacteria bacterium]|nr:MAG: hypothetical protein Ct9H300mP6_00720 [Gammaproteobacteria bacterium]